MPMWNITNINGTGLDTAIVGIASAYPGMMQIILFFEFLLITLSGTYAQKKALGITNLIQWATIGAFVTTVSAFILYLVPGMLDGYTLSTCIAITVVLAFLFFFSGREDD